MQLTRTLLPLGALLVGGVLLLVRVSSEPALGPWSAVPEGPHECILETGREGWCEPCSAGSLAGLRIDSQVLFEALDAHGHEVDPSSFECASCRAALVEGSFCESCGRGFVEGQAYLSRLSYHLARGKLLVPEALSCQTCLEHVENPGWCSACERGMIGNVAIDNPREHALAAQAFRILVKANQASEVCETCAAAMVLDGMCPRCRIEYSEGRALDTQRR